MLLEDSISKENCTSTITTKQYERAYIDGK